MKQVLKTKSLSLRISGYSLREISEKLRVSKSTDSLWTRGVQLDDNARARLDGLSVLAREKALTTKKYKKQ